MINPRLVCKLKLKPGDELPAFAWPGGYAMFYWDEENSQLCAVCATKTAWAPTDPADENYDGHTIVAASYFEIGEGEDETCDECHENIDPARRPHDNSEEPES